MADPSRDTIATYVDAALELQGIAVEPGWRDEIAIQFRAIEAAYRRVLTVPIDDEVEAAAIFTP